MAFLEDFVGRVIGRVRCGPEANISKTVPKERKKNAPTPLPALRPRALSLSTCGGKENLPVPFIQIATENEKRHLKDRQYICDQKQCRLLHRLPLEIRLQIWRYCVASFDIHVVRGMKKLIAIPCLGEEEQAHMPPCQHKCWGGSTKAMWGYYGVCPGYYFDSKGCAPLPDPIPLLQSCRIIYSEAINTLYSENSFLVNHVDTIINLSHTILPSRLDLIHTLHVTHTFPLGMYTEKDQIIPPYDANTWEEACQIIANMKGLKELHVHLGGSHLSFELDDVLRPLHKIRQVDIFDVFVGISRDPETVYTVERPFRFVSQHYDLLPDWECC